MIAYINGIIADKAADNVVLDVQGIGYNVKITAETASRLPAVGEKAKLHTYTCVREDAFLLYGFPTRRELEIFRQCITVSGIGPKGAMAILSVMDADSFRYAVVSGDVKAISRAPGIGNRTAERLILDLKDKIKTDDVLIDMELADTAGAVSADTPQKREAVEALVSLGYGQTEALRAVNAIEGIAEMDSGAVLKAALKKMF